MFEEHSVIVAHEIPKAYAFGQEPFGLMATDVGYLENAGIYGKAQNYVYRNENYETETGTKYNVRAYRRFDIDGNEVSPQVQRRDGEKFKGGGKYKSPGGKDFKALNYLFRNPDTDLELFIEGTKQPLSVISAMRHDLDKLPTIVGFSGCHNWGRNSGEIKNVAGKNILALFDADVTSNRSVYNGAESFRAECIKAGAKSVRFVLLPKHLVAHSNDGIDDILSRMGYEDAADFVMEFLDEGGEDLPHEKPRMTLLDCFEDKQVNYNKLWEAVAGVPVTDPKCPFRVGDETGNLWYWDKATGWSSDGEEALKAALVRISVGKGISMHFNELKNRYASLPRLEEHNPSRDTFVVDGYAYRVKGYDEYGARITATPNCPSILAPAMATIPYDIEARNVPGEDTATRRYALNGAFDKSPVGKFLHGLVCPNCVEGTLEDGSTCRGSDELTQLLEHIGASCFADNARQSMLVLYGRGRNGKGVTLNLIRKMVGSRNASSIATKDWAETGFRTHHLIGKTVNLAGDNDSTPLTESGLFKSIMGNDRASLDVKHKDAIEAWIYASQITAYNDIPKVTDHSDGMFSRFEILKVVRAEVPFKERDSGLASSLTEGNNLPLLMRAALDAYAKGKETHFTEARSSLEMKETMRDTSSPVSAFITEHGITYDESGKQRPTELHQKYITETGSMIKANNFSKALVDEVARRFGVDASQIRGRDKKGSVLRLSLATQSKESSVPLSEDGNPLF